MINRIEELIKRHEGLSLKVYYDSVGVPTVGYGHALLEGSSISQTIADALFQDDMKNVYSDYKKLDLELSEVREGVIVSMLFNLGYSRLCGFKRMLRALRKKDYETAADEMLRSKWANQVKVRALELSHMMRSNQW